jgi:3-phenylpropionate/trans-cinnamate dioxygenase ferredoxin subunit
MCTHLEVKELRVNVGTVEELTPGTLKRVALDGFPPLVVGNAEGRLFALLDECSHGESSLAEGHLEGCVIVCALHAGSFDVLTGNATKRPAKRPQPRYDIEIENDMVFVLLDVVSSDTSSPRSELEESPAKFA